MNYTIVVLDLASQLCRLWMSALCMSLITGYASAGYFVLLGHLRAENHYTIASGVSADGSVVVGFSGERILGGYGLAGESFRWTRDGGMVGLGVLSGRNSSYASGVSADGSVVAGFSGTILVNDASIGEASRWTIDDGLEGLTSLPNANTSFANDVSADGSTVVGRSVTSLSNDSEAFLWTREGGIVGLGDLPGGEKRSTAIALSAVGSVVVGSSYSEFGDEAFRWTSDGGMVGLGHLPGGRISQAIGVSADGSVVVGFSHHSSTESSRSEAFRWTASDGMIGLGDLSGGTFWSGASDVSADGSVVVGYGESANGQEAIVWDAANGMRSVSDLLLKLGVDLSGWRLTSANAISADGSTIAGHGINPSGQTEAWLANISVPEPSALLLANLAIGTLMHCRRRRCDLFSKDFI